MRWGDLYACTVGRTKFLWEICAEMAPPEGLGWQVEVDAETGIAYTRALGEPLEISELSPWGQANV